MDSDNNQQPDSTFEYALTSLINKYSKEKGSDTPDFILAVYLSNCLNAFNGAIKERREWYKGSVKA